MEITVLAVGWLLGGIAGVGTVLYALAVGPITQFFMHRFAYSSAGERPGDGAPLKEAHPTSMTTV
ncbi:hypothetical protein ACFYWY_22645 [Streptomyces sp. NPDC002870]|uniref:hypothetical protein n=1 Tax=Streptomyces sp. NPDC002870 TaxID=3364666 RepID=UPI0036CF9E21